MNWTEHYSPEQVEAIKAAEKVIPKAKFSKGLGPRRSDPWSPNYLDNLSEVDPVVDKPVRAPLENLDDNQRLRTKAELADELQRVAEKYGADFEGKAGDDEAEANAWFLEKVDKEILLTTGKPEAERNPPSAMAPSVPVPRKQESAHEKGSHKKQSQGRDKAGAGGDDEEASPALVRLMQMTGYDRSRIARLRVKSLLTRRVTNQTRLGKISRIYVLTVAGNGKGLVGLGEGKAEEAAEAKMQSQYRAIRNMQPIMRYENRTIYGDLEAKVGATELELFARPPGMLNLSCCG